MNSFELLSIIFCVIFAGCMIAYAYRKTNKKSKKSKAKSQKKWSWTLQVDTIPNLIYNGKQQRLALG